MLVETATPLDTPKTGSSPVYMSRASGYI